MNDKKCKINLAWQELIFQQRTQVAEVVVGWCLHSHIDCYTVTAWWLWDMATDLLVLLPVWLAGLNKNEGLSKATLYYAYAAMHYKLMTSENYYLLKPRDSPLHSPNAGNLPAIRAVQGDCETVISAVQGDCVTVISVVQGDCETVYWQSIHLITEGILSRKRKHGAN